MELGKQWSQVKSRWECATGTDNEELLQSQFYVGSKHKRVRGDVYYELLDEFISAAKRR